MEKLTTRLISVKAHASSYRELMAIYTARKLIMESLKSNNEEERIELFRTLRESFEKGADTDETEKLLNNLTNYRKQLKHTGVSDWQIKTLDESVYQKMTSIMYSFIWLTMAFFVAVPAMIITIPQRLILIKIGEDNRKKAVASSSVKVKGEDVVASYKFLFGIPVQVFFSTVYNIIYFFYFSHKLFDGLCARLISVPVFCLLFSTYLVYTMNFYNGVNTHIKIIMIRVFAVIYKGRIAALVEWRANLQEEVLNYIEKYDKLVMRKYDEGKKLTLTRQSTKNSIDTDDVFSVLEEFLFD